MYYGIFLYNVLYICVLYGGGGTRYEQVTWLVVSGYNSNTNNLYLYN